MDATLTLQRTAFALDTTFKDMIDVSDVSRGGVEERQKKFRSRALAAFCISALTRADPKTAGGSITDDFHDKGIDAIFFDSIENTLYLVQAKWRENAQGTLDVGDCAKFISGVQHLIRGDFVGFCQKIRLREAEIKSVLLRSDVRISLVVGYSSPQALSMEVKSIIDNFIEQQNNVGDVEVFKSEIFDLKRIYGHLSGASAAHNIKLQIALGEWGKVDEPYRAFYGQIKVTDIAGWSHFGKALLDRNIRFYRGSTDVNNAMENTILQKPEVFWYFNNGITLLCERIAKTVLNGDSRDYGIFDCSGVSVVNGAQTVGVVWELARRDAEALRALSAKVHVRLISLENCPEGFDTDVTRATNTQNRIQHRDFAALDHTQQRLARELALDGKRYAFKSGDPDPKGDEGCNIEEATIALACSLPDVTIAVQAKREIGGLWRDIHEPPYTMLFNEKTSARDLWRAVTVSRAVSKALDEIDTTVIPRGDAVAVHGNRFILHRVFQEEHVKKFRDPLIREADLINLATKATQKAMEQTAESVQQRYPDAYLAPLFKNAQRCKELLGKVEEPKPELTLFDWARR